VQTERFPAAWNAMHGGIARAARRRSPTASASSRPGALTLPVIRALVDDVVLVSEDDIEQAILMLLEIEKTVVEGAGAVGLAALMKERRASPAGRSASSSAAATSSRSCLAEIIERGMVKSGRLARLRVDVRDVPGRARRGRLAARPPRRQHRRGAAPARLHVALGRAGADRGRRADARRAHVQAILEAMRAEGYDAERVG
jgi:threonine dehydratase